VNLLKNNYNLSNLERVIRLHKVLKYLNISFEIAVDFFKEKGIFIEDNPDSKISDAEFSLLQKQFAIDKKKSININRKSSFGLKILYLQYEFNANWKCMLEFLKENNFNVVIDSKFILNNEQYGFIKLNFTNNKYKTKIISDIDNRAKFANTTVSKILEYFNKAKIKYQLSENGNYIINLDFKTWHTLLSIIDIIATVPIEKFNEYMVVMIDDEFLLEDDFDEDDFDEDDLDSDNSNYIKFDNSLAKGLYNIGMGNFFGNTWSCDLCDGDSHTGCLLSDKSSCIK
jgi:hypothetical protein